MREWVSALSACTSLSLARSRAKLEIGSAHAKSRRRKKTREEFCGGFLNPKGQAAVVVDEAVLAYASGWYRASAPSRPGSRVARPTSRPARPTVVGGSSGTAHRRSPAAWRPWRADGTRRVPATGDFGCGSRRSAGIIGTFGLTVKLGSATFEFLFSTVPKSTKSIGGAPEGRQCAPSLGRRVSPSLAELTVAGPD